MNKPSVFFGSLFPKFMLDDEEAPQGGSQQADGASDEPNETVAAEGEAPATIGDPIDEQE